MLRIYICEDNKEQREKYKSIIENIVLMEDLDLLLALTTGNPHEILAEIKDDEPALYFLDIDLECDMNGLTLAQKIREKDARGFIVFVTAHSEMSYMTFKYKVEAMDFIIKEDENSIRERLYQCVIEAYSRYSSPNNISNKVFKYVIGDKEFCVPYENIVYFETSDSPHKLVLHGTDRECEFGGSIKELENKLDERFFKVHRSFLINKNFISEIDMKEKCIIMKDGSVCFSSAKLLKELCK